MPEPDAPPQREPDAPPDAGAAAGQRPRASLAETTFWSPAPAGSEPGRTDPTVPDQPGLAGRYRTIAELGRWRFGTVVEAEHVQLGRRVWLYKLDPDHAADPATRAAVLETVRRAVTIDHPNVRTGIREAVGLGEEVWIVRDPDDDQPPDDLGPGWKPLTAAEWLYPNARLTRLILEATRGLAAVAQAGLRFDRISADMLRCDPASGRLRLPVFEARLPDTTSETPAAAAAHDVRTLAGAFQALLCDGAPVRPLRSDQPRWLARAIRRGNPGVSRPNALLLARGMASGPAGGIPTPARLAEAAEALTRRTVELADWPDRLLANLLDLIGLFLLLPLFLASGLFAWPRWVAGQPLVAAFFDEGALGAAQVLGVLLTVPAYLLAWQILTGSTPGHFVRGLHLIDASGSRPPRWRILDRFVLLTACVGLPVLIVVGFQAALGRGSSPPVARYAALVVTGYVVLRVLLSGRLGELRWAPAARRPGRALRGWLVRAAALILGGAFCALVALLARDAPLELPGGVVLDLRGLARSPWTALLLALLGLLGLELTAHLVPRGMTVADWASGVTWGLARRLAPAATLALGGLPARQARGRPHAAPTAAGPERRIGQYRLLRELGKGGMGTVFEAYDEVLQRTVAVKRVKPALEAGPEVLSRFEQEARLAARIDHAHVARLHGVGHDDGQPYMVMEYIEGRSLAQILEERGPFPVAAAWSHIAQAALGLRAAHRLGIIHRDIKPSNLILTSHGQVKVLDFGISTLIGADEPAPATVPLVADPQADHRLTRTGALVGTPLYMSPEQARGQALDARSDIYSLGLTLYHLLSGRPPFPPTDLADLVLKQCETQPPPLLEEVPDLTDEQAAVIDRMIAKDPTARHATYDELLADLARTAPRPTEPAPILRRGLAVLIDLLVVLLPAWLNNALLGSKALESALAWAVPLLFLAGLATAGMTPGKWLLGMRVRGPEGMRLGIPRAALRLLVFNPNYLGNILGDLPGLQTGVPAAALQALPAVTFLGWVVSVFLMASDGQLRALHDRAAGTLVVRIPRTRRRRTSPAAPPSRRSSTRTTDSTQTTIDLQRPGPSG